MGGSHVRVPALPRWGCTWCSRSTVGPLRQGVACPSRSSRGVGCAALARWAAGAGRRLFRPLRPYPSRTWGPRRSR
ncbi:hypothetical protein C4B68_10915 [Streptomyces dengpaensis]|uniref:Uncharacterized protein n=1 Tax=Streptomyces dengpaensis TaxID=2049881 RepID=A0ABM6SNM4_9ACTN|nr:hypothetical protein C4B68_10915 [Streptomyces dengpaensis]PIB07159.1 hypothetical protein B1C81_20790 [Streptomyces sp. HG99]